MASRVALTGHAAVARVVADLEQANGGGARPLLCPSNATVPPKKLSERLRVGADSDRLMIRIKSPTSDKNKLPHPIRTVLLCTVDAGSGRVTAIARVTR